MDPISLTLTKWKIIGGALALLAAMTAAAAAGAVVNGWRLDAEHQRAMATEKERYATLDGQYNALSLKVVKQDAAVDVLGASKKAAEDRAAMAQRYATNIIDGIDKSISAAAGSKATNCDGVLREAWGGK